MAAISGLDGITEWHEHQTCQPEEDKNNPWSINSSASHIPKYSTACYHLANQCQCQSIKSRRKMNKLLFSVLQPQQFPRWELTTQSAVPPYLHMQNLSPKDITESDIMRLKVSWHIYASLVVKGLTTTLTTTLLWGVWVEVSWQIYTSLFVKGLKHSGLPKVPHSHI